MKRCVSVLGGDPRQLSLAELLREEGHTVHTWGLAPPERERPLSQAAAGDIVILPQPVSPDGVHLSLSRGELLLEDLWPMLQGEGRVVLGGRIDPATARSAQAAGIHITDYFRREELQVANAVPTAEGALAAAMAATDRTLQDARCLVIGFGRIGKLLAHRLRGLAAQVSVSARRYEHLAWIEALGYAPLRTDSLAGNLRPFHVIFNTVPALVLDRTLLEEVRPDCVIIDVASLPGGVDFSAARELGITALQELSLPGRVAPLTAAKAVRDAVHHILEERGEPI